MICGVVYDPVLDECFAAEVGHGATLNGQAIATSSCQHVGQALIAASLPALVARDSPEVDRFVEVMIHAQSIRRLGSAALNLCYVAMGRLDAYWATCVQVWDVAAGLLMVTESHNLQSTVAMDAIDHLFRPETQINIYRIFQESLTNVVKHAGASLVSVTVKRDDGRVAFMIKDNGQGFDPRRAMSRKATHRSLGLTAMNERALMAAGSLKISSRQGQGTTIKFLIPINN